MMRVMRARCRSMCRSYNPQARRKSGKHSYLVREIPLSVPLDKLNSRGRQVPPSHERAARELILVFESPSVEALNYPDNLTVSPRGGIVMCEDRVGGQHLRGLTREGAILFDRGAHR